MFTFKVFKKVPCYYCGKEFNKRSMRLIKIGLYNVEEGYVCEECFEKRRGYNFSFLFKAER